MQKVFIARKSPFSPPPLLVSPRCPQLARVLSRRPLIATALPGEGEINKTINQVCQEGNQSNNQSIKALPGRREINQSKDKSSKQSIKRVISDGWSGLYWRTESNNQSIWILACQKGGSWHGQGCSGGRGENLHIVFLLVIIVLLLVFIWLLVRLWWSSGESNVLNMLTIFWSVLDIPCWWGYQGNFGTEDDIEDEYQAASSSEGGGGDRVKGGGGGGHGGRQECQTGQEDQALVREIELKHLNRYKEELILKMKPWWSKSKLRKDRKPGGAGGNLMTSQNQVESWKIKLKLDQKWKWKRLDYIEAGNCIAFFETRVK